MDSKVNTLNWFEIAVSDFDRAKKFYETVFGITMPVMEFGPLKMGMFPMEPGNGKPDLSVALGKVEAAGGKIMRPKTIISPEFGYMAVMIDTEGNAIALHSQ